MSPEAIRDRGLADAGFADQNRVVLGAPGEHLHQTADLLVAADDRIELAGLGELSEVAPIVGEGVVLVLGVGVGHAVGAPQILDGGEQSVLGDSVYRERARGGGVGNRHDGHEQVFHRHVLVLELGRQGRRLVENLAKAPRGLRFGAAFGGRQAIEGLAELRLEPGGRHADLGQQSGRDAALLQHQCGEQVGWVGLGVAAGSGKLEGRLKAFTGLDSVFIVAVHGLYLLGKTRRSYSEYKI